MKRQFPSRLTLLAGLVSTLSISPAYAAPAPGQWICETGADGGWACYQATADGGRIPAPPVAVERYPEVEPAAPAPAVAAEPAAPAPVAETAPPRAEPAPRPPVEPEPAAVAESEPTEPTEVAEPEAPESRRPVAVRREEPEAPAPLPARREEPLPSDVPEGMAERYWESENRYALCGVAEEPRTEYPGGVEAARRSEPVRAAADEVESESDGLTVLTGDAWFKRADQELEGDRVVYDKPKELADAEGNVRFRQQGLVIEEATTAHMDLAADTTRFDQARYRLPDNHAHGEAAVIAADGAADTAHLEQVTYTTCAPGKRDWELRADKVDLDNPENEGIARNATLRFKDVPIFYSPWLSFPIDERRKSGFLTPSIGSSKIGGFDFSIPYYWNIAPHRDATITPRIIENRGLQLAGEFRFLEPKHEGEVNVEFLPDDDLYGDSRNLIFMKHTSRPMPGLTTDLVYNEVSDRDYLNDLGGNLVTSNTRYLDRRFRANYSGDGWRLSGLLQSYQPIGSTTAIPYERLPQILFTAGSNNFEGINYGVEAEYAYFDHAPVFNPNNGIDITPDYGSRFDVTPRVSYEWRDIAWFLKPSLSYRYTTYALDHTRLAGANDSPSRGVPVFSVDGGLFFEREFAFAGTDMVQTLEPRLFYLHVPFEDHTGIPRFDSGARLEARTFNYFFRENSFNGKDYVSDADQLALGVTTRFIEQEKGRELLSASAGQIFYFDDRQVRSTDTNDVSDFVIALTSRPTDGWYVRADWVWGEQEEETMQSSFRVQYKPGKRRIANFKYSFREQVLEQTDLSVFWPVSPNWAVVGRWNYDLMRERDMETLAGFEYQSCCWKARLVGRHYFSDVNAEEADTGIFLELELTGLGTLGTGLQGVLERSVTGYHYD